MSKSSRKDKHQSMAVGNVTPRCRSSARRLAEEALLKSCAKVSVYKPFFISGIVTVLTAGCMLGALALFGISLQGSYIAGTWTPYVLAHANSQLYGWVGFFVIGFSLQHHAPTVARQRTFHGLAWATLGLMSTGILLRFLAEPFAQTGSSSWVTVGVFAGILQAIAVVLFITNTAITRYRPTLSNGTGAVSLGGSPAADAVQKKPLTWPTLFVFFSLFCFLAVAVAEPVAFAFSHQADKTSSVLFVAEWFPVLRESQFLGFVASMIFGVGLAKFHECLGAPEADRTQGLSGLFLWVFGLVARTLGWLTYFRGGMQPGTGWLYFLGGALLCFGAVLVIASSGVFGPLQGRLRSHKFLRAAFAWLGVAGLMMVLEPLVLRLSGQQFSHAYTGAVRHAVTVGFISQMIIGFSSRIVPNILGVDPGKLPGLWATFWLLNIGNAMRVGLEVSTDFSPLAFKPMGFTGFIELIGIGLWAAHILQLFLRSRTKAVGFVVQ